MKNFTGFLMHFINKSCDRKILLFITVLSCVFSMSAQFRLVKDIRPGTASSLVGDMYEFSGRLFFSALTNTTHPITQRFIHASDGTDVGTVNLTVDFTTPIFNDLAHNPDDNITFFTANSDLFFEVKKSSNNERILQKLTGNSNISSTEYSISYANGISSFNARFAEPIFINNQIIFTPLTVSSNVGVEPHVFDVSNPTNSGVFKDVYLGPPSSDPHDFTLFNGEYYFSANDGVSHGREIWKTDGTAAGTVFYLDVIPGIGFSNPDQLNVVSSNLTFVANHDTVGRELFKTNGSGNLGLIRNIHPTGDSNPLNVTSIDNTLYFNANNGSVGIELWKSNGNTSLGTTLVKDINVTGDSNPSKFIKVGTDIFFVADDGVNGVELWKTDGSPVGTNMVKNINPTGSSSPDYFTEYNGKLYFTANDGTSGTELWVSDGTVAGTVMIELNPNGDASVSSLIVFNNELYFTADDSVSGVGNELWAYQDPALYVEDFDLNNTISIFPNPTSNYFEIESTSTIDNIEIYSLKGQSIKSFEPQNQYDISEFSIGVYFVKIQSKNGEVIKRIIKE
ncbi:ELWxxDGT repeat protein [Winogradskyella sp.]|uniref:ELWxxDGT repeat protein n=1 Tax=Winogradskyella sp. TaxID=1883156 RepID=UPI0025FF4399|nr:ELWxxDGT repeat protein [Winogradskyella sp.]